MKNSIPLITKGGNLCGCVVEEGPQSIIILSDNKEDRKEIMNSLVHQYISELSAIQIADPIENDIHNEESGNETQQYKEDLQQSEDDNLTIPLENQNDKNDTKSDTQYEETPSNSKDVQVRNEEISCSDLFLEIDEYEPQDYETDFVVENSNLLHTNYEATTGRKPRSHSKHSKPSASSPLLAILICLLLCFIGIIVYFLILKPLQTGISISDNLFRLFPFLSRRFL